MRFSYSIDGVQLNDPAGRWFLEAETGRRGLPAVRSTSVVTPGRHGEAFVGGDTFESSRVGLSIIVTDKDAAGVERGIIQTEENLEYLTAVLLRTDRLFRIEQHTRPGVSRVAYGRVVTGADPVSRDPMLLRRLLQLVVKIPSVFWSDPVGPLVSQGPAATVTGALALPLLAGGSAPITDAIIRFKGPFNGVVGVGDAGGMGTQYAWASTPHASPSTQTTVDGTLTNLATNPSFETDSGTVEVYRNLIKSPQGGASRWVSGGWGSSTLSTESSGGPIENGAWTKGAFTTDSIAAVSFWTAGTGTNATPVIAGATYEVGFHQISSKPYRSRASLYFYDAAGAAVGGIDSTAFPYVLAREGIWIERKVLVTIPAGVSFMLLNPTFENLSGSNVSYWKSGDYIGGANAWVSNGRVGYLDGSFSPDSDLTPSWVGAVNNSESVLTGVLVTRTDGGDSYAAKSTQWFKEGANSLRIIPQNASWYSSATIASMGASNQYTLVAGKTYTVAAFRRLEAPLTGTLAPEYAGKITMHTGGVFSGSVAAPNEAGEHLVRWTFTVPPSATVATLRLGHGGAVGSGSVWWDMFTLVEGNHPDLMPFTGDTESSPRVDPTGLTWVGNVPAGQYVYLNAQNLKAHTSTSADAWLTGTDASAGLDYPPAGPLELTPAPTPDGTKYALTYQRPAALVAADAVGVKAGRKYI